jgi:hypothetical protein
MTPVTPSSRPSQQSLTIHWVAGQQYAAITVWTISYAYCVKNLDMTMKRFYHAASFLNTSIHHRKRHWHHGGIFLHNLEEAEEEQIHWSIVFVRED